jgi:hypothetical protein
MLQPQQIISIEVDSNPSARYDASYSSVVRVKTNRQAGGTSGQIANRSYFGRKYSNATIAQLQITKNRWVNYLSYQYLDGASHNYINNYEHIRLPGKEISDTIYTDDTYTQHRHSLLYGSTFSINPRHQLSWQYSGRFNNIESNARQREVIRQSSNNQDIDADLLVIRKQTSNLANIGYRFIVDSVRTLDVTADWARSSPRSNETVSRHYLESDANALATISNRSLADVFSAKAEYVTPLWGADLLLGARYGHIDSRTTSRYNNNSTETMLRNDNVAAFATLGQKYNKWEWSVGLRGELLNDKIVVNGTVLRTGWQNNLFPSAALYTSGLSKVIDLSFSYTGRIRRPSVKDLNPAAEYINSIVTYYGNPLLLSTIHHNVELGFTLWGKLSLILGLNHYVNPSISAGELDEDSDAISFKPLNVPRSRSYLINATYNNSWGPVSLTLNSGVEFPRTKTPYLGETITVGNPSWFASINTDVKLAKNTTLTAGFDYTGHSYYLMTKSEPTNNLTFGVTQYLFDRRLQIAISGYDLLRGLYAGWRDRYGFYETAQTSSRDMRYVRISARWSFNKYKTRYKERSQSEEFNRVN